MEQIVFDTLDAYRAWSIPFILISVFLLGAITCRIRGGWLATYLPGGVVPRLIMAIPLGCVAYVLMPVRQWEIIPALALATYAGFWIPHGRQMDMGTVEGEFAEDFWHMTTIGLARTVFIGFALCAFFGVQVYGWITSLGWLTAFGYGFGWAIVPKFRTSNAEGAFIDGPCAIGELWWGGMAFAITVLCVMDPTGSWLHGRFFNIF